MKQAEDNEFKDDEQETSVSRNTDKSETLEAGKEDLWL